jgi:hypothetical protein
MDIPTALTAISTALKIAKDLQEIDKGLAEADLKLKIAELTTALADAKLGIVDVQETIAEKDAEIGRLRRSFEIRAATVERNGFKYDVKEDGNPTGRPYCSRCEVMDGVMIRLSTSYKEGKPLQCPQCKHEYFDVSEYL